jgi:hypothetical protein
MRSALGVEEDDQLVVEPHGPTDEPRDVVVPSPDLPCQRAQRIADGDTREWVLQGFVDDHQRHRLDRQGSVGPIQGDEMNARLVHAHENAGACLAAIVEKRMQFKRPRLRGGRE